MNENILKSVLEEMLIEDFSQFYGLPEHRFSRRHEHNMKKIFGLYESNTAKSRGKSVKSTESTRHFRWNRRTVIIAAVIIFLAALAGCAAVICSLGGFQTDVQSDNTQLFPVDVEGCRKTIEYVYGLSELPEGFELLEHFETDTIIYTSYLNSVTEQTIVISQSVKTEFHPHYDTERFELEEIILGEHTGVCLGRERVTIAWDNGDYILEISANLNKNDVLKLVKSTKVLEN